MLLLRRFHWSWMDSNPEKDDDSDYSETFEEEATEECILLYSVRYVAEGHCKRLRALFDLLILPIKTWFD